MWMRGFQRGGMKTAREFGADTEWRKCECGGEIMSQTK